jgi:putative intracellular protease/amidase
MWDLPDDPGVGRAVEAAEASRRVVAAVCHGPAGLVGAKRRDGRPLVEGRRVAGFTDAEERASGLADVVPFLLETRLRQLGGRFEGVAPWQPFAVRDGRLVTGQNPQSSERVAGLLLEAFGVTAAAGA